MLLVGLNVVRGNAVRQVQEGSDPDPLSVPEQLDLGPAVGTTDHGKGGDQQDASEWHWTWAQRGSSTSASNRFGRNYPDMLCDGPVVVDARC